ncbi:hypothetical protein PUR71_04140 [Streptomyces sp. SP17BM10]|uniref:hypothetical protein n=1 Tax=Streptomyces sp. SP17BM10 TaxID=3002530 RepID=UPI002E78AF94|nr:hypothetical protein [Streptomyces sp. SP17BM10]MEE1782122.1 hypothetical protein [Streptomyces sp. SP17BM10]
MAEERDRDRGRRQAPVVWVLAVREAVDGPPFAELIVEVGAGLHADLAEAAVDSGFVVASGEPPGSSGVVEVGGGFMRRLVLVGGLRVWEPQAPLVLSPGWLAAAEERGGVLVMVVPPGTWPADVLTWPYLDREAVFARRLEDAWSAGLVLFGMTAVETR